ncbi:hypothetical protein NKR23_g1311 [Pleurostoma richardsiae]|uniref:Uncharacterized protein n=1 Tax=Pleurostoma richardsiae TaxID=41990 RepID=A0AA38VJT7_9PEZI|nr:hypothetical protein NKR23_g1311 [Pleurostoma richardsiae]
MARTIANSSAMSALLLLLLTLPATALALSAPAAAALLRRDYADEVCKPATAHSTDPIPPCVEIETIETLCAPNGTDPIDYAAHAECMCGGSYFADWDGCQACLELHGQRSERDEAFFRSVASAASHSLCDFLTDSAATTPTAVFASLFVTAEDTAVQPTTGATVSSDAAPSSTAVSLYFTPSGVQGPGAITGEAATATATGPTTTPTAASTSSAGGSTSGAAGTTTNAGTAGGSGTAAGTSAATTASDSGASVLKGAGAGLLVGAAALAVAAAC